MRTFCGLTTDAMLEYLASIYQLGESNDRVTTTGIAEAMCVSLPAASSMLKRLEESGFVVRSHVDGITLTEQGNLAARQLLRRHRLLEVYLIQIMGFTWDQVEAEAHRLEHAISSAFEERMDALCGYPTHCPHGDPIPRPDGTLASESLVSVPQLQPGDAGLLRRVASRDASVLRYLSGLKLMPGCRVRVVDVAPFNGPITLELRTQAPDKPATNGHPVNGHSLNPALSNPAVNNLHWHNSPGATGPNRAYDPTLATADALPTQPSQPADQVYTQILGTELAEQLFVLPQPPRPTTEQMPPATHAGQSQANFSPTHPQTSP